MSTQLFRYENDVHGRPEAFPLAGAHTGLAAFLTEEASWTGYVDLLLDCVAAAKRSGQPEVNTGNGYAVTIDKDSVVIEHLHKKGHPRVTVALPVFVQALREWRGFLSKSTDVKES
jgi:hypothetical protein